MKFELPEHTTVKLDNFQARMERHGDQLVPAVDLHLTWKTHNRALDALMPELREMLYKKGDPPDEADQAAMDLPVDDLSVVRFPAVKYPIKSTLEFHGMRLVVDYGLGGARSDIVLTQCEVSKFEVTPISGGSMELSFRVSSAKDIDEDVAGRLPLLQQQDIHVTLTQPVVEDAQADIETSRDLDAAENFHRSVEQTFLDAAEAREPRA